MSERTTDSRPSTSSEVGSSGPSPDVEAFDEQAVADILRRAAALDSRASPSGASLSRAELEQIARESGIEPAMVGRAIEQRKALEPSADDTPTRRTFERMIDVPLTPEHHDRLASLIRSSLKPISRGPVQVSALGTSLSASAVTAGHAQFDVSVSPDGARTRVRVTVDTRRLAHSFYGGILGGGSVVLGGNTGLMTSVMLSQSGTPDVLAAAAGLSVFSIIFAGLFTSARTLFMRSANRLSAQASSLADELAKDLGAA